LYGRLNDDVKELSLSRLVDMQIIAPLDSDDYLQEMRNSHIRPSVLVGKMHQVAGSW
jgi:hypothetical protein